MSTSTRDTALAAADLDELVRRSRDAHRAVECNTAHGHDGSDTAAVAVEYRRRSREDLRALGLPDLASALRREGDAREVLRHALDDAPHDLDVAVTAYAERAEDVRAELRRAHTRRHLLCVCVVSCADNRASACSLSGEPHTHPDDGSGTFGPCPIHPDAPGDR